MKPFILTSFIFFAFLPTSTLACSCGSLSMSVSKINHYDLMFKGEIIAKETVDEIEIEQGENVKSMVAYYKYTFKVLENIKPKHTVDSLVVYSIVQSSACGVNYQIGDGLYIFGYLKNGFYTTNLCAANKNVNDANRKFKKLIVQFKNPKTRTSWKDESGKLVGKGSIVNNNPVGYWVYYHRDGTMQTHGYYIDGKKVGKWANYLSRSSSKEFIEKLDETQRRKIKLEDNVLVSISTFQEGNSLNSERIFQID